MNHRCNKRMNPIGLLFESYMELIVIVLLVVVLSSSSSSSNYYVSSFSLPKPRSQQRILTIPGTNEYNTKQQQQQYDIYSQSTFCLYSTFKSTTDESAVVVPPSSSSNDDDETSIKRSTILSGSLIEQTLADMNHDIEYQANQQRIQSIGIDGMTKEERIQRKRALDQLGIPSFAQYVQQVQGEDGEGEKKKVKLEQRSISTILQMNIGLYCNQACSHCHVDSSPLRVNEMMTMETIIQCLRLLQNSPSITTLDITGGAPELHESFRYLVTTARALRPDLEIIDRCNLTVLLEPGQEDLISFLSRNHVRIVASLPCYSEKNVNEQRGKNVFERSIRALQLLNEAGYGRTSSITSTDQSSPNLMLDLVYNPSGGFLPPSQSSLQEAYQRELYDNYQIVFNNLLTITNMPIKRFADTLVRSNTLMDYMNLLVANFNLATIHNVMCLNTVSVQWDGHIYDCDFNQQLNYKLTTKKMKQMKITDSSSTISSSSNNDDKDDKILKSSSSSSPSSYLTVFDLDHLDELQEYKIRTDNHCFGCTAGSGSSCQGATV